MPRNKPKTQVRPPRRTVALILAVTAIGVFALAGWVATRPAGPTGPRDSAPADRTPADPNVSDRPPNVVLFLIDTLRADRLSCYGHKVPTTPNIDALASSGVLFEQCNAAAPWTLPSIVSMLTSTLPCEHNVVLDGQKIDASLKPLAQRLHEIGYSTAGFWANPYAGPLSGLDRGLDHQQPGKFTNGEQVDAWANSLSDKPFFLYIHNIEPHNPYNASDQFVEYFGDVSKEIKDEVRDRYLNYRKLTRADFAAKQPIGTTDNTAEQQEAMRRIGQVRREIDVLYDACVRQADARVASVIDVLKRRGVWDNTLFIVTSDHGEEFAEHGGWLHDQSVCQELLHVPLIVRFPGDAHAGRRVSETVSLLDVMPTALDAVGRPELSAGCRGVSLMPAVRGGSARNADEMFITAMRINRKKYYRPYKELRGDFNVAIRQDRFKGIWNVEPETFELYDLMADPAEQKDLAGANPDKAEAMVRFARERLAECAGAAPSGQNSPVHPDEMDEETLERLRSLGYVE